MKLLGSTKKKITKTKNGKYVPHFDIIEVVVVNNDYQQDLRVLYAVVPNKSFGQFSDLSLIQGFCILKYSLLIRNLKH